MVHGTLFSLLIKDYLRVKLYPATVAGISYNVEATSSGMQIQIIGYNHHIQLCMQIIVKTILELVDGDALGSDKQEKNFGARLELLMDRYDKELKNWAEESPYKHAKGRWAIQINDSKNVSFPNTHFVLSLSALQVIALIY